MAEFRSHRIEVLSSDPEKSIIKLGLFGTLCQTLISKPTSRKPEIILTYLWQGVVDGGDLDLDAFSRTGAGPMMTNHRLSPGKGHTAIWTRVVLLAAMDYLKELQKKIPGVPYKQLNSVLTWCLSISFCHVKRFSHMEQT